MNPRKKPTKTKWSAALTPLRVRKEQGDKQGLELKNWKKVSEISQQQITSSGHDGMAGLESSHMKRRKRRAPSPRRDAAGLGGDRKSTRF